MRFIIFTFSLAEIRLCRTDVRRRNGYSTILRIFIYSQIGDAKKSAGRKILINNKVFARMTSDLLLCKPTNTSGNSLTKQTKKPLLGEKICGFGFNPCKFYQIDNSC